MKVSSLFILGFLVSFFALILSVIYVNFENILNYFDELKRGNFLIETVFALTSAFAVFAIYTNKELSGFVEHLARVGLRRATLLQEGATVPTEPQLSDAEIRAVIRDEIKGISTARVDVSPEEREVLLRRLENRLEADIGKDFSTVMRSKYLHDGVEALYLRSLNRLKEQVTVLGSRANTSLMIGIVFSVIGLFALYVTFFSSIDFSDRARVNGDPNSQYLDLMREYLPRLSLVLIIEIVGFFFLRLYSKALNELRYAQNETTNVEMKLVALVTSIANGYQDSAVEVIKQLGQTERNNIIERTQTTIEIEKERSNREGEAGTINAISSLLHGSEKGWFWKKRE